MNEYYEDKWGKYDKGTFEWLFGKGYNDDGGTNRTLGCFKKLAKSREEIYQYTCSCHGNGTSDSNIQEHNTVFYFNKDKANNAKNELLSSYTKRMKRLVTVEVNNYPFLGVDRYRVESHQTIAFFMMTLADLAVKKEVSRYNVAPQYESAKASFCFTAFGKIHIGGMFDAHMPGTYYLIAHNDFKSLD